METGPGRAVLLALSGLPNFTYPLDIGDSHKYFFRDIVSPPFTLNEDATLTVPRGIGLGVEVMKRHWRITPFPGRSFVPRGTLSGMKHMN